MKVKSMKKTKKKFSYIKLMYVITAIIGIAMISKGFSIQPTIDDNDVLAAKLSEDIEIEKRRVEELDAAIKNIDTDEYIEKIAREKLGMIKANEIVFVDISGQ